MNAFSKWMAGMLMLVGLVSSVQGQSLGVENVRFEQDVDMRVTVTYDLLGKTSERYTVILSVFIPQSRKKIPLTGRSLQGAVGAAISPGKNLQIEWDLRKDFPGGLEGDGFRFIVDAYVQQKRNKWPWIVAGLAAVGGTALLFSGQGAADGDDSDLPAPPNLPANND